MLPKLSLILGAAASGKSAFAERLTMAPGKPCLYVATARASDREMRIKIERHQARRGDGWTTLETSRNVAGALAGVARDHVVLFDCATLWLANQMDADAALPGKEAELLDALATCAAPVVAVSNELGAGTVPDHALTRAFRQAHGEMNQRLAAQAGLVVQVVAGLPMVLKGTLPAGLA